MKINHKAAVLAAALLSLSLAATPATAAGTSYESAIGGVKTTTFTKYVTLKKNASLPEIDFSFSISAGQAKTYDVNGKRFQVLAGIEPGNVGMKPVDASQSFHMGFSQDDPVKEGANAMVKNYSQSTHNYVEKTGTLDFTNVHFTEPGVYRYILTEHCDTQSVYNDAQLSRIIDVYIVNDETDPGSKKLKIGGYVLHANSDDLPAGDAYGTTSTNPVGKSQGFTNDFKTADLTFRKKVTGNQASKDKYFKFTVKFTGGIPRDEVSVNLKNADSTVPSNAATANEYKNKSNPTKLKFGDDGSVTGTFYLQNDQEIIIEGIPTNVNYEVTEASEDYKPTPMGIDGYKDAVNGKTDAVSKPQIKTSYLNTRDGLIPTGIAVAVGPFAILTLAAGAGLLIVMKKRHKA